jgi:hypothetical protein
MKNRFILPSVAQLVKFKAVKTGIAFKAQSEINLAVRFFTIMLSSKQFNQVGY